MTVRDSFCFSVALLVCTTAQAIVVDFEDLTLSQNTYYRGDPGVETLGTYDGSFSTGGAMFNNEFRIQDFGTPENPAIFKTWGGWAYSNTTDVTTPGIVNFQVVNESSAFDPAHLADGGGDASANYGVAFGDAAGDSVITLPDGYRPASARVNNTTYAALIMLNGDASGFAKEFGDNSATPDVVETDVPDWFLLKIIGLDAANQQVGAIDFYLADFRSPLDNEDYVIDEWTSVDLSSLAAAQKLTFALSSTDNSDFGGVSFMNTPGYFALDNLVLEPVPEPATWVLALFGGGALWWRRRRSDRG